MNRFIAACLVPALISGCAIKGEIQGLGQQIPSTVGQLDSVLNGLILQKAIDFHNLVVQLEAIDAAKGTMLEMQPATPTVGTPMTPMPAPVAPPTTMPPIHPPIVPPQPVVPKS